MSTLRSIVLCGGSGTRLWPLSRALYPKQFMDLGGHTLFGDTVDRAAALPVTRQTRCWPSSEANAHPSLPTEVESSLAPCFLLSPAKPLRWVLPRTSLWRNPYLQSLPCSPQWVDYRRQGRW